MLPNDYPPYSTVYYYFRKWRDDGSWKRIHDHLVQWVRVDANRNSNPTAASLDSQTVPTSVMVYQAVGYDGGKKIKGRKCFTLVDTLGLLIRPLAELRLSSHFLFVVVNPSNQVYAQSKPFPAIPISTR